MKKDIIKFSLRLLAIYFITFILSIYFYINVMEISKEVVVPVAGIGYAICAVIIIWNCLFGKFE